MYEKAKLVAAFKWKGTIISVEHWNTICKVGLD